MEAIRHPVVYITIATLFIVAFFQIKQVVESFIDDMNLIDSSGNLVLLDQSGNLLKLDVMGNSLPPTSEDTTSFFRRAFGSFIHTNPTTEHTSLIQSEEKQKQLASSIAKQIKDDALANRAVEVLQPSQPLQLSMSSCYKPEESDCLYQGQEYNTSIPSKSFDMSKYIRKDSIPCWGCTLPA
jgi:hypothetical protein